MSQTNDQPVSIDELVELLGLSLNDFFAVVDVSAAVGEKTKKVKVLTLADVIKAYTLGDLQIGRTINVTEAQGTYSPGDVINPTDLIPDIIENILTAPAVSPVFTQPTAALTGTIFDGSKDVGQTYSGSVILTFSENPPSTPNYGAANGSPSQFSITYFDENNVQQTLTFAPGDPEVSGNVLTVPSISIIADSSETIQGSVVYAGGTDGVVGSDTFVNPYKSGVANTSRVVNTSQFTYWDLPNGLIDPLDSGNTINEPFVTGLSNQVTYSNVLSVNQTITGQKTLVVAVPASKNLVSITNGLGTSDPFTGGPKTVNINGVPYKVFWKALTSTGTRAAVFTITFN